MIKTPLENESVEYLVPKKFPARVVALSDQPIFTAVQLTNATPKDTLKQFELITVEGLRWTETGTPFFKTDRGYIRSDIRQLVLLEKNIVNYVYENVDSVFIISSSYYYTSTTFDESTRTNKRTMRGERVQIQAVEWTESGLPRLKTSDGYITSNKDFVSINNKLMAYGQKISRKLIKLMKQARKFPRKAYDKLQRVYFEMLYRMFVRFAKVDNKKVLFLSDSRNDLSGNFQYIVEEIENQKLDFRLNFYLKKTNNELKSWREYTQLAWGIATSHQVILDDYYPLVYPLTIRPEVDLIQVWHAVGAFKTFGFSRVGKPGGPNPLSKNHRNYDFAVVSSTNVAPFYAEGFGIDRNKVLPLGAPRTDLFFDDVKKQQAIAELTEELPFIQDKKVVLFAPTFRGPGQRTAHYPYEWLDFKALYDALKPQGFVFLMKVHPFVKNQMNIPAEYKDFFYDVSSYREINDLLLVSDVLITDYSSVVFEYSLLKRKTIFFTPDLEAYTAERDFYVNYTDFVPGPIVKEFDDLVREIEDYKTVDEERLNGFLDYYFDDLDGLASKRFVDAMQAGFKTINPYKITK